MCDHLHDSTSRYDAAAKVLMFLLVCRTCGTEKVVEAVDYEPRPVWTTRRVARQLAALPVESSIPPGMTLADWRYRNLAA